LSIKGITVLGMHIVHHSEHKRYNNRRCYLQARYAVTGAEDSSLLAPISGREYEGGKLYSSKWRRGVGCGGRAVSLEQIKCVVDRLIDVQLFQDHILLESSH
jgi:hypothetical protein